MESEDLPAICRKKNAFLSFLTKRLERLNISSFGYLNCTQFLGAMNDNIFKLLIVYCFIHIEGASSSNAILALTGATYVIPFLLFSSTAGAVADRYSKRTIIVTTKIIEMFVMCLGMIAFALASKPLAFLSLFFLACHSALFGPCKYGIVPEIVPSEGISKANGILTSCTYTAIIIGTFLASFLTEITGRHFVLAVFISLCFSVMGFLASLGIRKTPPAASQKKVSARFISELLKTFRIIRNEPSLLSAVLGSAYFLFIGSFIQLNMIPYAMNVLHLSDIQGGYLFLLTALGIGAGSMLAGKLSGKAVELGLVPFGGVGMTACCFLLDHWSDDIYFVIPLVIIVGAFGGLYLVPLDSYIQVTSPKTYRGQVVGTVNFLGFFGVLCSAGMLYLLSEIIGLDADQGFAVIGIITLGMVIAITISMSGYVVRLFSFIFSYLLYPVSFKGKDTIPLSQPSFFFVSQPYWPWAFALLASQRRRMRLFTIADPTQHESILAKLVKRLVPIIEIAEAEDIAPQGEYGELIRHAISRGTSVAVFCCTNFQVTEAYLYSIWHHEIQSQSTPFFSIHPYNPEFEPKEEKNRISRLCAEVHKL
jgi:acyl-[acyl-carrier-protein]-phospholipid O-acyltransferase / long-chain-fatty-acid--[acyl-carrier-protein] ligase